MKYVCLLRFLCMFDIGQLEIYDMIGQAICSSRRAGGEVRGVSVLLPVSQPVRCALLW